MRYDCYENGEYMATLTCSTKFILYCDDEDILVAGRIEHHNINGYYFIDDDGFVNYLYNGMQGAL